MSEPTSNDSLINAFYLFEKNPELIEQLGPPQTINNVQPIVFMAYAMDLIQKEQNNEKDNAVFWYYWGQLRGRFIASIDEQEDRNPAIYASIFATVGPSINLYAFEDIDHLVQTLNKVIEYEKTYPLNFDSLPNYYPDNLKPREEWQSFYDKDLANMKAFIQDLDQNMEQYKKMREQNLGK